MHFWQGKEKELRRVLAENEELRRLLADSLSANSSRNREMPAAEGHIPQNGPGPQGTHFCVKSWLTVFSEV